MNHFFAINSMHMLWINFDIQKKHIIVLDTSGIIRMILNTCISVMTMIIINAHQI